jgi:hypothetical protein
MFRPVLGSSSGTHLKVKITNRMTVLVIKCVNNRFFFQLTRGSLFYTLLQEFDVFVLPVGVLCIPATQTCRTVPTGNTNTSNYAYRQHKDVEICLPATRTRRTMPTDNTNTSNYAYRQHKLVEICLPATRTRRTMPTDNTSTSKYAYRQHKHIELLKQGVKQGSTSELQKLFSHILQVLSFCL